MRRRVTNNRVGVAGKPQRQQRSSERPISAFPTDWSGSIMHAQILTAGKDGAGYSTFVQLVRGRRSKGFQWEQNEIFSNFNFKEQGFPCETDKSVLGILRHITKSANSVHFLK